MTGDQVQVLGVEREHLGRPRGFLMENVPELTFAYLYIRVLEEFSVAER